MKVYYTIIENNINIGYFVNEVDRDNAFSAYFLKHDRWGIKSKIDGGKNE